MVTLTGTYTDKYQLSMAQAYFLNGKKDSFAIFDYFFRKLPYNGGYAVFAGLEDLIEALLYLRFDTDDLAYLKSQGYHPEFIDYLQNFQFKGDVYACQEGEVVFPTCPIVRVEGCMIEAQIIETLLLNILNFQTLIATKASRMRLAAGERQLVDFGLRRAQGMGSIYATRAAMVGGFDATSHLQAARDYHIPTSGTMAHSYIQSYDDELTAFRDFAAVWPHQCVLLVDTYNTLKAGIPNAIQVGKELEKKGYQLQGIRLDSGNLAELSKAARHMLNEAGLTYVKIIASNQLDEFVIQSLVEERAPIDVFGVGTNLVIGKPDAALDGVYKLAFANHKPRIKLSETPSKITLPGKKQVHRLLTREEFFCGADVIALQGESFFKIMHPPFESSKIIPIKNYSTEPLLHQVIQKGNRVYASKALKEISSYCQKRLNQLPKEFLCFNNPKAYSIGLSEPLFQERNRLIEEHRVLE